MWWFLFVASFLSIFLQTNDFCAHMIAHLVIATKTRLGQHCAIRNLRQGEEGEEGRSRERPNGEQLMKITVDSSLGPSPLFSCLYPQHSLRRHLCLTLTHTHTHLLIQSHTVSPLALLCLAYFGDMAESCEQGGLDGDEEAVSFDPLDRSLHHLTDLQILPSHRTQTRMNHTLLQRKSDMNGTIICRR